MKMNYKVFACLLFSLFVSSLATQLLGQSKTEAWEMGIECPGGLVRFGLELEQDNKVWSGFLVNGPERIKIPSVKCDGDSVGISVDHYDSKLELTRTGQKLRGQWTKRRGLDNWVRMKVEGKLAKSNAQSSASQSSALLGRWKVGFESSEDPAVGIFKANGNRILGTFLTTTGDYRFLDGQYNDDLLEVSCFDGAHAFLFKAKLQPDGTLKGDFWSSNTWHEQWTATKDENAELPDDFKQTRFTEGADLGALSFPNLDGKPMRLDDPAFAGKARIIYVFGSWCPNCHDAADYFSELEKNYGPKGLSILGLAFELTGDFNRDAAQVRKYLNRHGSSYPVLIAGLSDKAKASRSLPFLDRVRSYPTTIFLDADGNVDSIHTGFTGPATGDAYQQLRSNFEQRIERLLANQKDDVGSKR